MSDFCNIVSQGFPGQHAWSMLMTPSGSWAAGPEGQRARQDGACSSPAHPSVPWPLAALLAALVHSRRMGPGWGLGREGWWVTSGLH